MKTIYDFVQEAHKQIEFNNQQIGRFEEIVTDNLKNIESLQARRDAVLQELAKIVSPNFGAEELSLLSKKIQSPRVAELPNMKLNERQKLEALIEKIEANNDFQRADALTNPKTGVIKMQIDEVMPMYQKANEDMNKIAALAGFKGLYERKYGTEIYPHKGIFKFLNSEYLEDWKNSDNICAALGEKDFVDVIYKFDEAKRISSELKTSISDLTEQERKINGMVEEHKNAKISLQNLDSDYNKKIGRAVIDYVKTTDKNNLQAFTNSYKGTEELLTALDGIEHQTEYLGQLNNKVTDERGVLFEKSNKIADEANRYQSNPSKYANKRFDEDQFNRRFSRDQNRYNKIVDRYHSTSHQIYVYNDYGRNSILEDFLWYDIMTDGTLDGNFIPQVQEYYNYHPNYQRQDYDYTDNQNDNFQDNS